MMMNQHNLEVELQERIKAELGGYNVFPPGWTEITPKDYAVKLHANRIVATDHRQMYTRNDFKESPLDAVLIIFPDLTGVATSAEYRNVRPQEQNGFDYVTKFWMFGCDHQFKETTWDPKFGIQLRGLHHWQCQTCGRSEVWDSSD